MPNSDRRKNSGREWRAFLLRLALPVLFSSPAGAHPAQFTTLEMKVAANGRFEASLNVDVLAHALGKTSDSVTNEELAAELDGPRDALATDLAEAGERFRRELVIRTDAGAAAVTSWQFPVPADVDAALARKIDPRTLVAGEITFAGALPAGARKLSVRLPFVLGDTMQLYELPGGGSFAEPVPAGKYSRVIDVALDPGEAAEPPRAAVIEKPDHAPPWLAVGSIVAGVFLVAGWLRGRRRRLTPESRRGKGR